MGALLYGLLFGGAAAFALKASLQERGYKYYRTTLLLVLVLVLAIIGAHHFDREMQELCFAIIGAMVGAAAILHLTPERLRKSEY